MQSKFLHILGVAALCFSLIMGLSPRAKADDWASAKKIEITAATLKAYKEPNLENEAAFTLYRGMSLEPEKIAIEEGALWFAFKAGNQTYWIKGMDLLEQNIQLKTDDEKQIVDSYGILELPHRYAVKLVKEAGARGRIETYEKTQDEYLLSKVYPVTYRKEGHKEHYADLGTVGGPVIRYLYRTTKSGMNGWNKKGEQFGVYKVSYPMPHDALPYMLQGIIGTSYYNNIPIINEQDGQLQPHPRSLMGADILIHTARWGSRGCINVENEAMATLYHQDLATENDQEIIPLVIYDEDMEAPRVGELF